jgi:FG-GAP-like repeat
MLRRNVRVFAQNLLGALFLAGTNLSCADLQPLEPVSCGNFVIDPGEDCDGHPLEADTTCGAVDTPHECRQVCDGGHICPTGWHCGTDDICRVASGSFRQKAAPIPLGTPNLMYAGDFDTDGSTDILLLGHENSIGTRPARIAYSQSGTIPADIRSLDLHLASPVLGDSDELSGTLDVAFATQAGISLLRGTATRNAEFGVFPYFNISNGVPFQVVAMDVLPEVLGDELVMLAEHANGKTTVSAFQDNDMMPLFELPYGLAALVGEAPHARFDVNSPCEQLVFAQKGANDLQVFSPCRMNGTSGWNMNGTALSVALPAGITVDTGILLDDFDLDGIADILIETNELPHIAWGTGAGTFTPSKMDMTLNMAGPYEMPKGAGPMFPLAVEDFNLDGLIDFVLPQGILASGTNGYVFVYDNFGGAWSAAVVLDLNNNGAPDVLVGSVDSVDCTFLSNTSSGVFNPSTITTEGPIQALAAADFDGDLVPDIAVLEKYPDPEGLSNSRLSVGFGKLYGSPEKLIPVGLLQDPTQLTTLNLHDTWENPNATDGIADVLTVDQHDISEQGASKATRHAVIFRGDGSRILRTSRPLRDGMHADLPLAVTLSKAATDDSVEITALGIDRMSGDLHLWTIEGAEADFARPGPFFPTGFHSITDNDEISFRYGTFIAAGNLFGDASDEVVVIAPFGPEKDGVALLVTTYDETTDTFIPKTPQPFSARLTIDDKFELHDIDKDGLLDGVLSTGTHEDPGDLIIFWGDGAGLNTVSPGRLTSKGGIRGFACLSLTNECPLVVTTLTGTYHVNVGADRYLEMKQITDLPGGGAIVTGDFDRDGLVDIALQAKHGLEYYCSIPVNQ